MNSSTVKPLTCIPPPWNYRCVSYHRDIIMCALLPCHCLGVSYYVRIQKVYSTTVKPLNCFLLPWTRGYILLSYSRLGVFYHNSTSCLRYTSAKSCTCILPRWYQKSSSTTPLIIFVYSNNMKSESVFYVVRGEAHACILPPWSHLTVLFYCEATYLFSTTVNSHTCIPILRWYSYKSHHYRNNTQLNIPLTALIRVRYYSIPILRDNCSYSTISQSCCHPSEWHQYCLIHSR